MNAAFEDFFLAFKIESSASMVTFASTPANTHKEASTFAVFNTERVGDKRSDERVPPP